MNPNHWNKVYTSKNENEVSWFQEKPVTSLKLIEELKLDKSESIIDIGGGDSKLVDFLLSYGYKDISILDISEAALERLKRRLPIEASVTYINSDITEFRPIKKYKVWHDRATFHFLTTEEQIRAYLKIAADSIEPDGFLLVSTFSKTGPLQCSGLPIKQYSDFDLKKLFSSNFTNLKCFEETHETPWGAKQDFVYCGFKKTAGH